MLMLLWLSIGTSTAGNFVTVVMLCPLVDWPSRTGVAVDVSVGVSLGVSVDVPRLLPWVSESMTVGPAVGVRWRDRGS